MTDRIDQLLSLAVDRLRARTTRLPESTYRLQFHAGFTFRDAAALVSYLADLGVTHLYASPILAARKGSTHGYDVIDPTRLNPELGTADDYAALCAALERRGMGQLLDTVPNHMGVGTNKNPWWNDLLKHGRESKYAGFFDIRWNATDDPERADKVTLPILGDPLDEVIAKGELRLTVETAANSGTAATGTVTSTTGAGTPVAGAGAASQLLEPACLVFEYFDRKLPVNPASLSPHLRSRISNFKFEISDSKSEISPLNLKPDDFPQLLSQLLSQQHYRLTHWRQASEEINYRRFFDINDLAALSMEKRDVFEAVHEFTLRLVAEGNVTGLRVDHPDGLYDPQTYFERLQQYVVVACAQTIVKIDPEFADLDWSANRAELLRRLEDPSTYTGGPGSDKWPLYVSVEKILAPGEPLPEDWPVHGTSGYDALNQISGLFVDPAGEKPLNELSHQYADNPAEYADLVDQNKKRMLDLSFSGELSAQARELARIAHAAWPTVAIQPDELRAALRGLIAAFPVYRTYISADGVRKEDVTLIEQAIAVATARNPSIAGPAIEVLRNILLQRLPESADGHLRSAALQFAGRFQQLTAPVTAKGIEDTTFYVYNRLLSLNEVGGEPGEFGVSPDHLHQYFAERQAHWPYALSALSTHDTKRSEDVRARIHVLSELPDEWRDLVAKWTKLNARYRTDVGGRAAPTANEEYWIYQTLIGVWPFEPADRGEGREDCQPLLDRVQAYFLKARREAKVYTSWNDPNADHEQAVSQFIAALFDPKSNGAFLESFLPFQKKVARLGMANSLSQTLLRLTAPGVPDTYQGTELWDLSLVDPDNRRPVDYELRKRLLADLRRRSEREDPSTICGDLLNSATDGRIKLYLTWRAISARKGLPGLFSVGRYTPIAAEGPNAANCFAFMRSLGSASSVVIVPRLPAGLTTADRPWPIGEAAFSETRLRLPDRLKGQTLWNLLTGESIEVTESQIPVGSLLEKFPVGLWVTDHM